jgi:hypothetical protein
MEISRGEIMKKILSSWKNKLLSLGGRLVLINLVLTIRVLYVIILRIAKRSPLQARFIIDLDSFDKGTVRKKISSS